MEGESDASEGNSDDVPLVCLTTQKRKVRVDDFGDQVPSTAASKDVPPVSTDDIPQANGGVVICCNII